MAPAGHPSSPLSSLSSLSPRSPRSSSLIARSQLDPDHRDQQPPVGHRDAPSHVQHHLSAAGQHEQARASGLVDCADLGHPPSDDDVKMGEVEGADAARPPSAAHKDDYERYEGQGAGASEVEVEVATGEVEVNEVLSQADFEHVKMEERSHEEPSRPAVDGPSSQAYIQQGSHDAHEAPSRPAMTWQPFGRFNLDYTSPLRPERSRSPPLTPRSDYAVSNFDLGRFAFPRHTPPPLSHAVYRYTLSLPLPLFGPRIIGVRGQTIDQIKRETNVCEVLVLFRQDRFAKVVLVGTRTAIEDAVKYIDGLIAMHTKLGPAEHRWLQENGMGWCRFDERKLEPLDGYWVHDVFAEPDLSRRRDERSHHTQAYGPAEGVNHGRARQPSPPPRRRSSRSLSPVRDSCRSPVGGDTPHLTWRSPTSPSLESPAEVKPLKLVDRISSRFIDDDAFSSEASQRSLSAASSQVLVDMAEEPTSSLTIPIPIAAIERFVGPNAAGHFITQTTGVELKVEAGLAGAALRLEPGAKASSGSLLEARQLVDKVLVSSGLALPAPSQGSSKERSTHGPRRAPTPFGPASPASALERHSSAPRGSVVELQREEREGAEGRRSRSGGSGGADNRWAKGRERGGTRRDSGWGGRAQERSRGHSSRKEEQTRSPALDRHAQYRSRSRSPNPRRGTDHAYDYGSHAAERSTRTGPLPRSPRYKSQGYPPPAEQACRDRTLPRADDHGYYADSERDRRRAEDERSGSAFDTWLEMRAGGRGDGTWAPSRVVGQWPGPRDSRWRR
ncbi:hypothetical protein JCM9279_000246 [Rhodotorula babjevae]